MKTSYYHTEHHNGEEFSPQIFISIDTIREFYPAHRHDFVEMYYVISGEGKDKINGIEHKLRAGTFVLLLPWHIHEIYSDRINPIIIYKCDFGMELLISEDQLYSEIRGLYFNFTNAPAVIQCTASEGEHIAPLFLRIKQEYANKKAYSQTIIKMKIIELLIEFYRGYELSKSIRIEQLPEEGDEGKIWSIITYIHEHITEDISLSKIAGIFSMEEASTNKLLQEHTGQRFPELVNEIRIRLACVMLSHSEIPISLISSALGFKSTVTFYRRFKDLKGMNSEEYKKNFYSKNTKNNLLKIMNPNVVWRIIYFIHLHFQEDITLASVADNLHYSEVHLRELMKDYIGESFSELLQEIRIIHACSILTSTKMPVADVAFRVGFDSRETFFRAFQRLKGTTPGKYRKIINISEE